MEPHDAADSARRYAGVWLDDLAIIIAGWLDARPVVQRLRLVAVIVLAGAALIGESSYVMVALAMLLLPRMPAVGGRIVRVIGALLAVGGTAVIVFAERTWTSFPSENGLGLFLLGVGLLLAARRGPWLLWLLTGAAASVIFDAPFLAGICFYVPPIAGALALILVARVSAVPRPVPSVSAARDRLAVALQAAPWRTSFVLCALATAVQGSWFGFAPTVGVALVGVLFHATWRAPSVFDSASAWAAALSVPIASAIVLWWLPWQASGATAPFAGGPSWLDFVLNPVMALPLIAGLLFGRRRPGRPSGLVDVVWLLIAALAAPATMWIASLTQTGASTIPVIYAVGMDHPIVWRVVTVAWLPLFHRLVATNVSARRIITGSLVAGVIQLVALATLEQTEGTSFTLLRGALGPVAHWMAVALVLLLARDIARVTRVHADHQLHTDFGTDPPRA